MLVIRPISTSIKEILKKGDTLIIREDSYKFEGISNKYRENYSQPLYEMKAICLLRTQ